MLSVAACTQDIMACSVDSGNGSLPPPPTESTYVSLSDATEADFDPLDDTFGLAFNIDHPGNLILNDYLQFLPIAEQEAALARVNLYETRGISNFEELLLVNLNELRNVTLLALSHLVHNYFHIY